MRCIEHVILGFGPFEQMELDKAGHLLQMRIARQPDLLECVLGALSDAKAIHCDEHLVVSWFVPSKWRTAEPD